MRQNDSTRMHHHEHPFRSIDVTYPVSVAVTGGAGFLGSAVISELLRRGHNPVAIDRDIGHDVRSPEAVNWIKDCDAVIHLAGLLGTAELFPVADEAVDVNIKGTLNILRTCHQVKARYVGISMPDCWANVYQATKHCALRFATAWHHAFGVPVAHVRAYNAYGPGQKYGPGHPQKILPTFAICGWNNIPIPVWGEGSQLVDLVHVADVARMLVDALAFGDDQMFDAGTGRPITVKRVAEMVIDITGSTAGIEYLPMRSGETPTKQTYARGEGWPLLDWRPKFDLDRFIEAVQSYKNYKQALRLSA